jgi:hypothetical protein
MIGKTLEHHRVCEQPGRGGMGEVYVAEELNLNRNVDLKLVPKAFTCDQNIFRCKLPSRRCNLSGESDSIDGKPCCVLHPNGF